MLLDSQKDRPAIVCGGAAGVFGEFEDAQAKLNDPFVLAVNDVGMFLPRIDAWVSLHTDHLGPWKNVRWLHPRDQEHTKYHAPDRRPFVDYVWEGLCPLFCLSGYFAMQISWLLGCSPIVLCGCPGMPARRFFEAAPRADFGYGLGVAGSDSGVREQVEKEMERLPEFRAAVRSMSGWTRDFFGGL